MLKIEDRCCGCAAPGYPCEGNSCPNKNVRVYYCDKCGDEITDEVYEVDGKDLCEGCLKKMFLKEVD
jgi:hypothetical protein